MQCHSLISLFSMFLSKLFIELSNKLLMLENFQYIAYKNYCIVDLHLLNMLGFFFSFPRISFELANYSIKFKLQITKKFFFCAGGQGKIGAAIISCNNDWLDAPWISLTVFPLLRSREGGIPGARRG